MPSLGQSSTSTSLEATVSPFPERIKGSRSIECAHGRVATDQAIEGKEQGLESLKMAPLAYPGPDMGSAVQPVAA